MADKKSAYDIIFGGKDNVSSVVSKISGSFDTLKDKSVDISKAVLAIDAAFAAVAVTLLNISGEGKASVEKLRSSLGILPEDAEKFGKISKEIYSDGLTKTMEEATDAVSNAFLLFGSAGEDAVKSASKYGSEISRVFGSDIGDTLSTVKTLMDQFGLSSDEAFAKIAIGFRKGLDRSGDFLDTINEYSVQFKSGGASADQFFSLISSGALGGVLGVDRAADAFKEFRDRIQDGSDTTKKALESIGISSDKMGSDLAKGTITAAQAFEKVIEALNKTDDSSLRIQAGAGLLGTQFVDLGDKVATSLSFADKSFEKTSGVLDSLSKQTLTTSESFEIAWRKITGSITDSKEFKRFESNVSQIFSSLGSSFEEAFKGVDFSKIELSVKDLFASISGSLGDIFGGVDLSTAEGLKSAISQIVDGINLIINTSTGFVDFFTPLATSIADVIRWFTQLDDVTQKSIGYLVGLGTTLLLLGGPISSVVTGFASGSVGAVAAAGAIGYAFGSLIRLIPGVDSLTQSVIKMLDTFITGTNYDQYTQQTDQYLQKVGADVKSLLVEREKLNEEFGKQLNFQIEIDPEIKNIETAKAEIQALPEDQRIQLSIDAASFQSEYDDIIYKLKSRRAVLGWELETLGPNGNPIALREEISSITDKIIELGKTKSKININADSSLAQKELLTLKGKIDEIDRAKTIRIKAETEKSYEEAFGDKGYVIELINGVKVVTLSPKLQGGEAVKEEVKDLTKDRKFILEIETKRAEFASKEAITRITEETKRLEKNLDFELKIQTLRAETELKRFVAAIESSAGIISSLSDSSAKLFEQFSNKNLDLSALSLLREQLQQNLRIQEQQAELNRQLTLQEIERARLMNRRLSDPNFSALTVTVDNSLDPDLQMILRKILERSRFWGTEYGLEALINAPT